MSSTRLSTGILLLLSIQQIFAFLPALKRNIMSKGGLRMGIIENFDAILFDCDGVIAETERDAHRITFNQAFKEKNVPVEWDVELYGELLKVGGGKERMTAHFNNVGWPSGVVEEQKQDFVKELHKSKTAKFQQVIESGAVKPRPGVTRLIDQAFQDGVKVAICSTSNEAAVTTIAKVLLGEDRASKIQIFAGDVVENKKPAPDVYLLGAKTLGVDPSRCWVVEDTEIGLKAAMAAGMKCIVTKSVYTENEDFTGADAVVKDLDNGLDGPITTVYLDYKAKVSNAGIKKTQESNENADLFGGGMDVKKMAEKFSQGDMGRGMNF